MSQQNFQPQVEFEDLRFSFKPVTQGSFNSKQEMLVEDTVKNDTPENTTLGC